jgi:hypothetical protein
MPGLGKKTFTAGDVLIAGDVNNYLMDQTVMNFATVAARSSAIPVPSTGMVTYVGDTGTDAATNATIVNLPQMEAYTGAAWQSLDGLTLVARATITGTVATVTMSNVFSAAYDTYKIIVTGGALTTTADVLFQLTGITTGYETMLIYGNYAGSSALSTNGDGAATSWTGSGTVNGIIVNLDLSMPFAAKQKQISAVYNVAGPTGNSGFSNSFNSSTASASGFTMSLNTGSFTGGDIYIYGYRKS